MSDLARDVIHGWLVDNGFGLDRGPDQWDRYHYTMPLHKPMASLTVSFGVGMSNKNVRLATNILGYHDAYGFKIGDIIQNIGLLERPILKFTTSNALSGLLSLYQECVDNKIKLLHDLNYDRGQIYKIRKGNREATCKLYLKCQEDEDSILAQIFMGLQVKWAGLLEPKTIIKEIQQYNSKKFKRDWFGR